MRGYTDDYIREIEEAVEALSVRLARITGVQDATWAIFHHPKTQREYVVYYADSDGWVLLTAIPEMVSLVKAWNMLTHTFQEPFYDLQEDITQVPDWYTNNDDEPLE